MQADAKELRASGIVGAGGAGFPTHVKYRRTTATLIVNVQDSEPGYVKDKWLMRARQETLLRGLPLLRESFGFARVLFALKRSYQQEFAPLADSFDIVFTDDMYWNGEAKRLVEAVLQTAVPTNRRTQDFDVTVNCLETVLNLCEWLLVRQPVTEKYLQVYGEVQTPRIVRAPVGTPAVVLLSLAGLTHAESGVFDPQVLAGGPMMGSLVDLDRFTVQKTTNDLFVAPADFFRRIEATTPTWRESPREIAGKLRLDGLLSWHPAASDLVDLTDRVHRVGIDLQQTGRFGQPARPVVRPGEAVERGQPIAAAEGADGVDLHASIGGFVAEVTPQRVVLSGERPPARGARFAWSPGAGVGGAGSSMPAAAGSEADDALRRGMAEVCHAHLAEGRGPRPRADLLAALQRALREMGSPGGPPFGPDRFDAVRDFEAAFREQLAQRAFRILGWPEGRRVEDHPTGYRGWDRWLDGCPPLFAGGADAALRERVARAVGGLAAGTPAADRAGSRESVDDICRALREALGVAGGSGRGQRAMGIRLSGIRDLVAEEGSLTPAVFYEIWEVTGTCAGLLGREGGADDSA